MKKFQLCDYKSLSDFNDFDQLTPREAICAKCMDCCGFEATEVKRCTNTQCALHQLKERWFRTPKKLSEETLAKLRERNANNQALLQYRLKKIAE